MTTSRGNVPVSKEIGSGKMLSARIENPLCKVSGIVQGSADRDCVDGEEVVSSITAKLPYVENIPPYTTWIFLDKYDNVIFLLSFLMLSILHEFA